VQGGVRSNLVAGLSFPPVDVKALNLAKTFKGHLMSVSSLAMHPTKPIVVCSPSLAPPPPIAPVVYVVVCRHVYGYTCMYTCMYMCICIAIAMAIAICMKGISGLLCGRALSASSVTHHCFAHHHCASTCACAMGPT